MTLVCVLIQLCELLLFLRVIVSWFRIPAGGAGASLVRGLYTLTEPVLRPLRSLIPPVQMGPTALDLSPIVVFLVLVLVAAKLC